MSIALERLRRPEYTGENRCWPCTVVNACLLLSVAFALSVFGAVVPAAVVAAVGAAAIALRGYVVPYTPRFAPRLASYLPFDPFHPHGEDGSLAAGDGPDGEAVAGALLEAGVVAPAEDESELRLDPDFRRAWRAEMESLRSADRDELAAAVDAATPDAVAARPSVEWNDEYVVLDPTEGTLTSVPRAVAVAELAAVRALEGRIDDDAVRLAAGRPLRPFLGACPVCDGDLMVRTETCCGGRSRADPPEHLVCEACGAYLFTYDADAPESDRTA